MPSPDGTLGELVENDTCCLLRASSNLFDLARFRTSIPSVLPLFGLSTNLTEVLTVSTQTTSGGTWAEGDDKAVACAA